MGDMDVQQPSTADDAMSGPYDLGRSMTVAEAITILRRATFDPGVFTQRVSYNGDEVETLERWQARAAMVALSDAGPLLEGLWSQKIGHFTEYEADEVARVLDRPIGATAS